MPGNFVFKPIEGHFKSDNMDPYLKFTLGEHKAKSHVTTDKGCNPHWNESFTLNRTHEEFCEIHVRDKASTHGKEVGVVKIPLADIEKHGKVRRWFDIGETGKPAGQILMEVDFDPSAGGEEGGQPQHMMHKEKAGHHTQGHEKGKEGVSGQTHMHKEKIGGSHLTHEKEGMSGQSQMKKEKYSASEFAHGTEGVNDMSKPVSGQSNTNQGQVGTSNIDQGKEGSGMNKYTNIQDFAKVSEQIGQGKEGIRNLNKPISGQSYMNKEQVGKSDLDKGKEGISGQSHVNKGDYAPSKFAQGEERTCDMPNMMDKEKVGASHLSKEGEGASGIDKPFNMDDFIEGKKFSGL